MPLQSGDKLGPYECIALIGKGGMGEVWKAHDSRLKRDVAIKVSAAQFSERFEREAQAIAALNHPNICQLYDVGPNYLVMEYIEGTPLKGPLPVDQALKYAAQICDALDAAHKKGITHRDLKPANILVSKAGIKLLDFGLAKLASANSGPSLKPDDATLTMALTGKNEIVGTLYYMSPEQLQAQANGQEIDGRSDIFSFGLVLYEILTGKRAFEGSSPASVIAAIMERPAPSIADVAPAALDRVLKKCLAKDPDKRWQTASDLKDELEWIAGAPESGSAVAAAPSSGSRFGKSPWIAAGVLAIGFAASSWMAYRATRSAAGAGNFAVNLNMDVAPAERLGPTNFFRRPSRTAMAISPDGATIVFGGEVVKDGKTTGMLYRRALSNPAAAAIPGTENAEYPFFSPDGQWVGFAAGNKLKKVALGGGPPIDLCDFPVDGRIDGASWGASGMIVFARLGLWSVSDAGGKPAEVLKGDPIARVRSPALLPDGYAILFTEVVGAKWEEAHVDAIDMKTKQRKMLLPNAADARYSPTGHLVFMRDAALLAVPFDAGRVEVSGAAVPLLAGVMQSTNAPNGADETGMGQFALSATGTLVYASGSRFPTGNSTLVRVDRKGGETKLAETKGRLLGIRISPDGSRAVGLKTGEGSRATDLWMYELPSGAATRLTPVGTTTFPVFSPDGKSVFFAELGANAGMYSLPLTANATPQIVMKDNSPTPGAVSADGKWLAYLGLAGNVREIFVAPLEGTQVKAGEARPFSPSTFTQTDPQFSPDGHWIAYTTNESGANEIYVQAFPGPGEKHRISSMGGTNPAWSHNGRELFYLARDPQARDTTGERKVSLMAVDVSSTGAFKAGEPHALFSGPYAATTPLRSYDVTADGNFMMVRLESPPDEPITKLNVVLGWAEELKRKVGGR